jgi:hypothetical protein
VRIVKIGATVMEDLPPVEREEVEAMVGKTFRVYEVDEHGAAWVGTPLFRRKGDRYRHGHDLGLDADEMELVLATPKGRPTKR